MARCQLSLAAPLCIILTSIVQWKANAFNIPFTSNQIHSSSSTSLHAQKQSRSSLLKVPSSVGKPKAVSKKNSEEGEEEVFGAKFFGGSAVKEELFDAELEASAEKMNRLYPKDTVEENEEPLYSRFLDTDAFPDNEARNVARRAQSAINQALYISDDGEEQKLSPIYSPTLKWDTPLSKSDASKTPIDELASALDFYKRIDIAVIAGRTISSGNGVSQMELRWEVSVVWPNAFQSRVLLPGTSQVTVDSSTGLILTQKDKLENGGKEGKDLIQAISSQLQPRFWDLYHIGMTPSAELLPRIKSSQSKMFSAYNLYELPPRLVLQPTIIDVNGRVTREAQILPNHAFSSIIKTTGARAQRYVPTSPIEVSIRREVGEDKKSKSVISWSIGITPEFVSYYEDLVVAMAETEEDETREAACKYVYQQKRLVATMSYGGNAQDLEVTDIRKSLFEKVTKDGLKPKLVDGRPQFFFWNNDAKACFTADGGLGMTVYDWRPKSAKANEIGIELES